MRIVRMTLRKMERQNHAVVKSTPRGDQSVPPGLATSIRKTMEEAKKKQLSKTK
jgi:hypothetical protein